MATTTGTQEIPSDLAYEYEGTLTLKMPNSIIRSRYPWRLPGKIKNAIRGTPQQHEKRLLFQNATAEFQKLQLADRQAWYDICQNIEPELHYYDFYLSNILITATPIAQVQIFPNALGRPILAQDDTYIWASRDTGPPLLYRVSKETLISGLWGSVPGTEPAINAIVVDDTYVWLLDRGNPSKLYRFTKSIYNDLFSWTFSAGQRFGWTLLDDQPYLWAGMRLTNLKIIRIEKANPTIRDEWEISEIDGMLVDMIQNETDIFALVGDYPPTQPATLIKISKADPTTRTSTVIPANTTVARSLSIQGDKVLVGVTTSDNKAQARIWRFEVSDISYVDTLIIDDITDESPTTFSYVSAQTEITPYPWLACKINKWKSYRLGSPAPVIVSKWDIRAEDDTYRQMIVDNKKIWGVRKTGNTKYADLLSVNVPPFS